MDDPATVECQCRAAVAMLERFPWSEDEEAHCLLYVDNYCQHAARFASLLAGADAVPAALAAVDELLHAIASAELRAAGEEGQPNFGHLRAASTHLWHEKRCGVPLAPFTTNLMSA